MPRKKKVEKTETVMVTMETAKPVIIRYTEDVPPTPDHPAGMFRGQTFEVATPEQAWAVHPAATIVMYADGTEYSDTAARREVKARDAASSDDPGAKETDDGTSDGGLVIPAAPGSSGGIVTTFTTDEETGAQESETVEVVPVVTEMEVQVPAEPENDGRK